MAAIYPNVPGIAKIKAVFRMVPVADAKLRAHGYPLGCPLKLWKLRRVDRQSPS